MEESGIQVRNLGWRYVVLLGKGVVIKAGRLEEITTRAQRRGKIAEKSSVKKENQETADARGGHPGSQGRTGVRQEGEMNVSRISQTSS